MKNTWLPKFFFLDSKRDLAKTCFFSIVITFEKYLCIRTHCPLGYGKRCKTGGAQSKENVGAIVCCFCTVFVVFVCLFVFFLSIFLFLPCLPGFLCLTVFFVVLVSRTDDSLFVLRSSF